MIVRGPFNLTWGENTLADIEEINIDHDIDSDDYANNSGKVFEVDKSEKIAVGLTLLASDIAALAAVFPQHFVPFGGTLSTGETIDATDGAIDFNLLSCDEIFIYNDLDIVSCGDPGNITRIKHTRTKLETIEIDKIQKVRVRFISEVSGNEASIQMLHGVPVDIFLLDDGDDFLFDDGTHLLL